MILFHCPFLNFQSRLYQYVLLLDVTTRSIITLLIYSVGRFGFLYSNSLQRFTQIKYLSPALKGHGNFLCLTRSPQQCFKFFLFCGFKFQCFKFFFSKLAKNQHLSNEQKSLLHKNSGFNLNLRRSTIYGLYNLRYIHNIFAMIF